MKWMTQEWMDEHLACWRLSVHSLLLISTPASSRVDCLSIYWLCHVSVIMCFSLCLAFWLSTWAIILSLWNCWMSNEIMDRPMLNRHWKHQTVTLYKSGAPHIYKRPQDCILHVMAFNSLKLQFSSVLFRRTVGLLVYCDLCIQTSWTEWRCKTTSFGCLVLFVESGGLTLHTVPLQICNLC